MQAENVEKRNEEIHLAELTATARNDEEVIAKLHKVRPDDIRLHPPRCWCFLFTCILYMHNVNSMIGSAFQLWTCCLV